MPEENPPLQGGPEKPALSWRSVATRGAQELGLDQVNFVKEALKWQYNWIGLAGAAVFALVSGTGLPLVLAAGLQLVYLSLVPQSSAFRRLVRSWRIADARKERDPETRRRRISSARQMLKAPEGWAGRVRGVSEWVPEAASIEMLRWISWAGYDVQYCDGDTPAGGDDDGDETTELVC